jgi:hypothetical protein
VWKQPSSNGSTTQYTLQTAGTASVPGGYGLVLRGVTPSGKDLASAFYVDSSVSIPGNIYKYLIYRSAIAPFEGGDSGFQLTNARILYTSQWGTASNWLTQAFPNRRSSQSQHLCNSYGQFCTYFVDLSQDINGATSPNPWDWGQPGASIKAFGLWPHEQWCNGNPCTGGSGDSPNYFYLDYVYLAGEIVAKSPAYTYDVRWNVNDPDGGAIDSTLYYQEIDEILTPAQSPTCDPNDMTGSGWTSITPGVTSSIDLSAGGPFKIYLPLIIKSPSSVPPPTNGFGSGVVGPYNQTYSWDLSGGAYTIGKVYYVSVLVDDGGGNPTCSVSSAPVIKAPDVANFSLP